MDDARERFLDAARAMKKAETKARKSLRSMDKRQFLMVIIDLDAAIPGLNGIDKGRAISLKAQALWWIYLLSLSKKNLFMVINDPPQKDPVISECHELAIQGKEILVSNGASKHEIDWIDDLIKKSEK